jgi:hypothetical protein
MNSGLLQVAAFERKDLPKGGKERPGAVSLSLESVPVIQESFFFGLDISSIPEGNHDALQDDCPRTPEGGAEDVQRASGGRGHSFRHWSFTPGG